MSKLLKGTAASRGTAQGSVRIINSQSNLSTFNHGEVLVTEETRPDFLPIMKKAAAVITSTGGVLCHAAIISRELKIPCLVGVHRATELLKDGEIVEVNTEQGTVVVIDKAL